MRKQLTGEPVAGKLHTGFGGRGRRSRSLPLSNGREESIIKQKICLFRVAAFIKGTAVECNPNEEKLNTV